MNDFKGLDCVLRELSEALTFKAELDSQYLKSALIQQIPHGDFRRWYEDIQTIHAYPKKIQLNQPIILAQGETDTDALKALLENLKPWRKGHFSLFDIDLDSEWRSELKYQRLRDLKLDWHGLDVLDVGCGNGYYLMRMLGDGVRSVIGIDPSWHYFAQYLLLKRLLLCQNCAYFPITLDDYGFSGLFDLTLSMGVFYHRRDPLGHLVQLRQTLKPKGKLVLETLTVAGDEHTVLLPSDRYAGMKNVYFLPSALWLEKALRRCGLKVLHISEPVLTTSNEQRKTQWIDTHSLADFLNAEQTATIENLPLPQRQMFVAERI